MRFTQGARRHVRHPKDSHVCVPNPFEQPGHYRALQALRVLNAAGADIVIRPIGDLPCFGIKPSHQVDRANASRGCSTLSGRQLSGPFILTRSAGASRHTSITPRELPLDLCGATAIRSRIRQGSGCSPAGRFGAVSHALRRLFDVFSFPINTQELDRRVSFWARVLYVFKQSCACCNFVRLTS